MENISQHDNGFPDAAIKEEEEEQPCGLNDSELETFSRTSAVLLLQNGFVETDLGTCLLPVLLMQDGFVGTDLGTCLLPVLLVQDGFVGTDFGTCLLPVLLTQDGFVETDLGYPDTGIKPEEEMDNKENADVACDQLGFLDIVVKSEENEGMGHQGPKQNTIVSGIPNLVVKPEEEEQLYNQGWKESTNPGNNQTDNWRETNPCPELDIAQCQQTHGEENSCQHTVPGECFVQQMRLTDHNSVDTTYEVHREWDAHPVNHSRASGRKPQDIGQFTKGKSRINARRVSLSSIRRSMESRRKMSANHSTRSFSRWSFDEITYLLERILHNKEVKLLMDSSTKGTDHIYRKLSRHLLVGGFKRSPVQIRTKFKYLRLKFYRTILLAGHNPDVNKKCPFFDDMKEIWEKVGRPEPHGGIHYSLGLSGKRCSGVRLNFRRVVGLPLEPCTSQVRRPFRACHSHNDDESDECDRHGTGRSTAWCASGLETDSTVSEQLSKIVDLLQDNSERLRAVESKLDISGSRFYRGGIEKRRKSAS